MGRGRLADLVIAGVPKAATGSLFAYLAQHPDVCASDKKETGYFNHFNPQRHSGPPPPIESYTAHFAHCAGERYALEATPTYSYGGLPVIEAMREVLGHPKVIITLRNPVDRLWSAYTFQRSLGNITGIGSFEEYVSAVEKRPRDGTDLVPGDHLHGLYIGFYANYVGQWLDAFGADLRIVFAEDLAGDPAAVVEGICRWLEIDPEIVSSLDITARNVTRHARSPQLAKAAFSLKRAADRLHLLPPELRGRLRNAYTTVNAGELAERPTPGLRRHVEEIYRSSNLATAAALAGHGYRDLPAWLADAGPPA